MFITSQLDLEAFVKRAQKSSVLAIDTEFMREKTYYAQLCLLQMQTDTETVLVDPFCVHDLGVLARLFEDEHIVKLFHAGSQDIEILYFEVGVMPRPVFDTQIAAALLGHSMQIGYGALVSSECGVQLKKIDSYTDWSRRPLSESQLQYAAEDVIYLPKMYKRMVAELDRLGRTHWLDVDFAALTDEAHYEEDAHTRWKRLKRVGQLSPRQLSAAREVAAWREYEAQDTDTPRKWVLTDEQIVEACKREARTIDELYMVRGLEEKLDTPHAREVVAALRRGLDAPESEWPHITNMSKNEVNVDVEVDLMTALVRLRARQNNIAFLALCNHDDLVSVARGYDKVPLLHGWRREIAGEEVLALLAGEISLSVGKDGVKVTKQQESDAKHTSRTRVRQK